MVFVNVKAPKTNLELCVVQTLPNDLKPLTLFNVDFLQTASSS